MIRDQGRPDPEDQEGNAHLPEQGASRRRGGTVSTKTTRRPRVSRNTTTPYRPAAAKSGRAAIAPENGALGIILWRCLADMADMDRFAAVKILHLARTEASGPDGAHLASVPHRDLIARTDFRGRIAHSDGENVADRMEVLDVDPVDVGLREDLAARQGEGQQAASCV